MPEEFDREDLYFIRKGILGCNEEESLTESKLSTRLSDEDKKNIINLLKSNYKSYNRFNGNSMFLLPDGSYLDVGDAHMNADGIIEKYLREKGFIGEDDYQPQNFAETELGLVHCGNTHYNYLGIPEKEITEAQYKALASYDDYYRRQERGYDIEVYYTEWNDDNIWETSVYYNDDTGELENRVGRKVSAEALLRNFYKTGRFKFLENLHEELDNTKIIDALKKEFGRSYPVQRCFILEDGSFLSTPKDGTIYNPHECLDDWLKERRLIDKNTKNYYFSGLHSITCNGFGEFYCLINRNRRPTDVQFESLRTWLDKYYDYSSNIYGGRSFQVVLTDDNLSNVISQSYNPKETIVDEIIKKIKRFYATGELVEKIVKKGLEIPFEDIGLDSNYETIKDDIYNTNWYYFGDCISTVDGNYPDEDDEEYWDYFGPEGADEDAPYWDATEMAQALEKAKVYLGKKNLIDAPKEALEDNVVCGVIEDRGIGFVYNIDNDIHYFFDIDSSLVEKIVKKGSKWQVQSEKGRNMGTYDTKEEAEKRLQQVHYFKYKNEDLNEEKVLRFPQKEVDDLMNALGPIYKGIEVKKLPIDKLVKDNDLLNDKGLESYHQGKWNHAKAKDFHIDQEKIDATRMMGIPFVVQKKDGTWAISDGKHRTRAAYNDGYTHVEYPFYVDESLDESTKLQETDSEGNVLSKEQITFFKDSKARDINGKLLVCEHYTNAKFDTFDKQYIGSNFNSKLMLGQGFYFTQASNSYQWTSDKDLPKDIKMVVYLNIKNPYILENQEHCDLLYDKICSILDKIEDKKERARQKSKVAKREASLFWLQAKMLQFIKDNKELFNMTSSELLQSMGFDGVFAYTGNTNKDFNQLVAFDENQIKAITNKIPTSSNNINESLNESKKDNISDYLKTKKKEYEEKGYECKIVPVSKDPLMYNFKNRVALVRDEDYLLYVFKSADNTNKNNVDNSGKEYFDETDSAGNSLTKEQVEFFKNSKIRNKNNKLLVCVHYTNNDFDTFDISKSGENWEGWSDFDSGLYFVSSDDEFWNKEWSKNKSNKKLCYLNIVNPFDLTQLNERGRYTNSALDNEIDRIINEYDPDRIYYTKSNKWYIGYPNRFFEILQQMRDENGYDLYIDEILKKCGYDGVVANNQIVAFEPNQIKSIDNKNPTSSSNINESIKDIGDYTKYVGNTKEAKDYLLSQNRTTRLTIFNRGHGYFDYLFADAYNKIHINSILDAIRSGYLGNDDLHNLPQCRLIYIPDLKDTGGYSEHYNYTEYIYDNFKIVEVFNAYTELSFKDTDLYKSLDEPKEVHVYKNRKLVESKQDIGKFRQWAGDELANRFFAIKDRIKDTDKDMRDIYWWMTQANKFFGDDKQVLKTLKDFVKELESIPTKKERNKNAREGSEKVYDDGRWLVLKINTYEASAKYGKHTQWCITGTNSSDDEGNGGRYDFGKHSKDAQIYFYIDRKKDNKYALEFKDLHDWCLWDSADFVECGEGKLFKKGLSVQGDGTWNSFDSGGIHPNFPNVEGLPDLNKAYEDLAKEQGWDKPIILEEVKNNVLDALDKEFGQEEVYMWSTYILPNGHFLNPDNAPEYWEEIEDEPAYEHCDFEDWAWSQGYHMQDIYDNCVKMNVTMPYLGMPERARLTSEQMDAIRKIINENAFQSEGKFLFYDNFDADRLDKMGHNLLAVYTSVGDEVFDLDVSDADDILRAINQAYVRGGFFSESSNIKAL